MCNCTHRVAVARAEDALAAYRTQTEQEQAPEEKILSDLLSDLMHLAVERQFDWGALLARAMTHARPERRNDETR